MIALKSKSGPDMIIHSYLPPVSKSKDGNIGLIKNLIKDEKKLIIILARHPVDRLFSAWSDKFRKLDPKGRGNF